MATLLSKKVIDKINKKTNSMCCRICSDEECSYEDKWLKPCKCKGSVEWVHFLCIKEWLRHSNKLKCEICLADYKLVYRQELKNNTLLDYLNPKIVPICFTIFFLLFVLDFAYTFTIWRTGSIRELYGFAKTFTFGLFALFLGLQVYCSMYNIQTELLNEIIYMDLSYGYAGLFFLLPNYIYKEFKNIINTNENGISNEIDNIVHIENY